MDPSVEMCHWGQEGGVSSSLRTLLLSQFSSTVLTPVVGPAHWAIVPEAEEPSHLEAATTLRTKAKSSE
jgi:hypothetical protein